MVRAKEEALEVWEEGRADLHWPRQVSEGSPSVVLADVDMGVVDLEATQEQSALVGNRAAAGCLSEEEEW